MRDDNHGTDRRVSKADRRLVSAALSAKRHQRHLQTVKFGPITDLFYVTFTLIRVNADTKRTQHPIP